MRAAMEVEEGVENGIITDWIERYYEEKLDKRDRKRGPGAYLRMSKKRKKDMLSVAMMNN